MAGMIRIMRRKWWLWALGVLLVLGGVAFGLDRWGPDRARVLPDDELQALAEDLPEPTVDEFPVRVVRFDFWGNVVPATGVPVFVKSDEGREEDPREFRRFLRDLPERPEWLTTASARETNGEGVVWLPRRADSLDLFCEEGDRVEWLYWMLRHGLPRVPPVLVLRPPPRLVIRTVDGAGRPVPYVACGLDCYREGDAERERLPILTGADGRRVISDLSGIVDYGDLEGRTLRGGARIGTGEGVAVRWPGWGETVELILTVPECGVVEAVPVPPEGCQPFETTVWIQGLDAEDRAVTTIQVQTFGNERVRVAVPLSLRVRVTWLQGESIETEGPR